MSFIKRYAKKLLTKTINYGDPKPEPVKKAPTFIERYKKSHMEKQRKLDAGYPRVDVEIGY